MRSSAQPKFVVNQAALAGFLKSQNPSASDAVVSAVARVMAVAGRECGEVVLRADPARQVRPAVEDVTGAGLGPLVSAEEGAARLRNLARPPATEDRAGELARPGALVDRLRVSRATLDNWRQSGDALALPKGKRAHVYPVLQFEGGRPLDGVREILAAAPDPSTAWRWLTTPHVDFDPGTPLDYLRKGRIAAVIDAAKRDFG